MSAASDHQDGHETYYVPEGSHWPFVITVGLVLAVIGSATMLNTHGESGSPLVYIGAALTIFVIFKWFGDVIRESMSGAYSKQVDMTFRWSMGWFIFSEVMFFGAFFGALFYARSFSVPWLSGESGHISTYLELWPNFDGVWPTNGPGNIGGDFEVMGAIGLPLINTLLLLTSGVTCTIAHHAVAEGDNAKTARWLAATVVLGAVFMYCQGLEYVHAYDPAMNLTLESGIYGSTFFLLTGFHGAHVTLGAIMLFVVMIRAMRGHFTADNHFAFEGAAWYWHFVDVVWLILFIFVYIL